MTATNKSTHLKCFDREVLADFTLGKLPIAELERIAAELETCPACLSALDALADLEDSVVADLRSGAAQGACNAELEEQIREAEQISRVVWREPSPDLPEEPLPKQLGQYEIMERIGQGGMGTDLGKLVRGSSPLPVADACEAIRQAALGLQYAHEHGLIHRDVKPSNLMLTSDGAVKVLDLGLARLTEETAMPSDMTGSGQVVGTGDFIAPEQGEDVRQADARSDIYSLGCTFYFLLAGRALFSGPEYDTFTRKVMAHVREPIPPIRSIRSDIPEAVVAVLERMVAKEPAQRFLTAAEVAEAMGTLASGNDLKGVVAGQGGHRGIAQPPHRSLRSRNSRPLLMVLLLLVPALVFGGWYAGTRIVNPHADEKSIAPSGEGPFIRRSEAEAEGKKIWTEMQPDIRKMNNDFAEMRRSMAADNEETMTRARKATAEAKAAQKHRQSTVSPSLTETPTNRPQNKTIFGEPP